MRTRLVGLSPTSIASIVLGCAVLLAIASVVDWEFVRTLNFWVLWDYRIAILRGLTLTLLITGVAVCLGLLVGVLFAVLIHAPIGPFRWLIRAYVELWRNTPLIVQLLWVHFSLPLLTGVTTTAVQSGYIAMSLQASAYLTDIARGGIQAVPVGQWEAARALGLPATTRWLSVILPQALKIMIPALANVAISFFKTSAVLATLSVGELMSTANRISEATFKPIETLTLVAAIYFTLGTCFSVVTYRLEALLGRSER